MRTSNASLVVTLCSCVVFLVALGDFVLDHKYSHHTTPSAVQAAPKEEWYTAYGHVRAVYKDIRSTWTIVLETDDNQTLRIPLWAATAPAVWVGEHIKITFGVRSESGLFFKEYKGWKLEDPVAAAPAPPVVMCNCRRHCVHTAPLAR